MTLKRRVIIILLVIMLALTLLGCTDLNSGTVTAKEYQPEEEIYSPMPVYTGKFFMIIPRWIHRPARYVLYIESGEDHAIWSVTPETYHSVSVGDYIER